MQALQVNVNVSTLILGMACTGNSNGSSDQLVAGMDQQNRVVEQGIAASLMQQLPLLTTVVRDAAAQTSKPV